MVSLATPQIAPSALTHGQVVSRRQRLRASEGSDGSDDEFKIDKAPEDIIPGSKVRVSLASTAGSGGTRFSDVSFDDDDNDDNDDDTASCGTPVYRKPCSAFDESEDGDVPEIRPRGRSRRVSFDVPEQEEEKAFIGRRPRSVEVHDLEALVSSSRT